MASEEVAPLLAKEFVTLKIDKDRMPGGTDVLKRYQEKEQGIPWFVFLDGDGQPVVNSTGPKGNVGFPAEPFEIAHFQTMLQTVRTHLTDAEISTLIRVLEAANKKTQ
jgi:uncharacterized protein YyaL (SSP411 family)